jgi:hypothetical protein
MPTQRVIAVSNLLRTPPTSYVLLLPRMLVRMLDLNVLHLFLAARVTPRD